MMSREEGRADVAEPYSNLNSTPFRASFTALDLVEREEHCSHLSQEVVYSLERVEPMELVHHCSAMAQEVKRATGGDWARRLHQ